MTRAIAVPLIPSRSSAGGLTVFVAHRVQNGLVINATR